MNNNAAAETSRDRILAQAPLARVLVQVRWPEVTDFNLEEVVRAMAPALSSAYPLKQKRDELQVVFTPAGPLQEIIGTVHSFASTQRDWMISIGKNFLALETNNYGGHKDFISNLEFAIQALKNSSNIPLINRVGYRYTNRIVGEEDLNSLDTYFSSSVLGGLTTPSGELELVHSITESAYRINTSYLSVRSAIVGSNESIDPTLDVVNESSWILDLDAHDERELLFEIETITSLASTLSKIASNHFHSLTTPNFVERYA